MRLRKNAEYRPAPGAWTRRAGWVGLLSLLGSAGCGPLSIETPAPSPGVAAAAESAAVLDARLQAIGVFPDQADMHPEAVLYTEVVRVPGTRGTLWRDTIRGSAEVERRLQDRRGFVAAGGVLFELDTDRVYQCDGVVLQYGTYPVPVGARTPSRPLPRSADTGAPEGRVPFAARWRSGPDGSLALTELWLGPVTTEVRVGRLGSGCRDTGAAAFALQYAQRRSGVEFSLGYAAQLPALASLEDGLVEHGWDRRVASHAPLSLAVSGLYRHRPGWQMRGWASVELPARVEATGSFFHATLAWSGVTAAGLLVRELGPFRVGAGPAVSYTRWTWSEKLVSSVFEAAAPSEGTTVLPGMLLDLGYIQTLRSRLYLKVEGRYGYFTAAEAPGFRDLEPVAVPMDGARVSAGIGYWW